MHGENKKENSKKVDKPYQKLHKTCQMHKYAGLFWIFKQKVLFFQKIPCFIPNNANLWGLFTNYGNNFLLGWFMQRYSLIIAYSCSNNFEIMH